MRAILPAVTVLFALVLAPAANASGTLGLYAVIERVEFEPNADAPERVRVHGAFAFFDSTSLRSGEPVPRALAGGARVTSPAARGYLYFRLPPGEEATRALREWRDLAAVAGTREGVAFGDYFFLGSFAYARVDETVRIDGTIREGTIQIIVGNTAIPVADTGLNVASAGRVDREPIPYVPSDVGVVRLGAGNYDDVLATLRALLDD